MSGAVHAAFRNIHSPRISWSRVHSSASRVKIAFGRTINKAVLYTSVSFDNLTRRSVYNLKYTRLRRLCVILRYSLFNLRRTKEKFRSS